MGLYSPLVQSTIGPSNYFRDHTKMVEYLQNSAFLPFLNNEKEHSHANSNKKRFESLNSITMVKFLKDPIIFPRESSWFGETNNEGKIVPMEETAIYKENKFGLKTLNDQKRVVKVEIDGLHLQFVNEHI